jgi:Secretion system C-terminal sorting domain
MLFKLYTLVFILFCLHVNAQVTITENDFASAGDAVWLTTAQSNNAISYQYGGADTTWDFSTLQLSSQSYSQFLNPLNTNPLYAINFSNVSFNAHRSNIAVQEANATSIPLVTITGVYNFYYKNSAAYVQKGIGESVNGLPTSINYSSPDTLYPFPLLYGNNYASASGYSLSIPSLGFYGYGQTRTSTVDGWGMVATPYGTFNALRVVSEISSYDSLYIDTFHFGFRLPLPNQRRYLWITNGEKVPVLQINTTVITGNVELVNDIIYLDSLHPPVTAISTPAAGAGFDVYPNPAHNTFHIRFAGDYSHTAYTIYDMDARVIATGGATQPTQQVNTLNWAPGIYIVAVTTATQTTMRKVVIN